MARHKIDPEISRKAYSLATKALKEAHADEFAELIDAAYETMGVESPRVRRMRLAAEAAEAAKARRLVRAEKDKKRLEDAAALLRAAGVQVTLPDGSAA